ncbi:hypothetical protein K6U06_04160 [Acidiferrimicrobium sp. IK]|uniref:hypothetical protein n=1 Tax=Acidiferrimicrobium sp. IK TaxID=2871700 RepID=UPI0021CB72A0|nr:hypothetical protein [Acidiferrimicrobium sp. IK]MCU4183541.1 hypothetical protein [Acidiferrimicrobium sp. IK]
MAVLAVKPAAPDGPVSARPIWARPRLVLLCVVVPLLELAGLWASGASGDRSLAPQVTAPAPWDIFHDLRWTLVIHNSWWSLALEGLGILVVRTWLDTLIVQLAWPDHLERPRLRAQARRTLLWVTVTGALLLPWTVLAFGLDVVSISWLFFGAVPPVIVVAMVMHRGPVTGSWWRGVPPWRGVGWILLTFVVESATGLVLGVAPAGLWPVAVAAGGLFNAWAWMGVVGAAGGRVRARKVPVAPTVAVGMVAVAVVGATIAFRVVAVPARGAALPAPPPSSGPPVLIVGGFDSQLQGADAHPIPGPYNEVRYSYSGLDPAGEPRPYLPAATHQSIDASVQQLAAQVGSLHRRTGQLVALVAESEGSLIARTYLAADPGAPVDRVILLSPLQEPGRVFYPVAGHQGYGVLTGYALRALTNLLGGISPVDLPADSPFLRSIVDHSGELRDLLACPTAMPEALVEPLADAVADPSTPARVPSVVVPAFHGGLLTDRRAQREVATLLAGGRVESDRALEAIDRAVRLAAAPWQVPALPLAVTVGGSDHPTCAAMEADIQRWIALRS